jgi:hydroxymethylglutaryl-CoA lyase
MGEFVRIVEVGARDGLQNEDKIVPAQDKIKFIKLLSESGLKTIEATSFVSPKAIPQMADAVEVFSSLDLNNGIDYPCLVPNLKGLETALKAGVKEISLFTATSDAFTKKNINCTVDESFERMQAVVDEAKKHQLKMRGYVSTAFGCPYQGEVTKEKLLEVSKRLLDLGVYEVSIGDTIGVGKPEQMDEYLTLLCAELPVEKLAMHLHDTYHNALNNIEVSLNKGIRVFDSSTSGLGGCPYADGATGNVSTESVLELLSKLGYSTNVDMQKIKEAGSFIRSVIG